MGQLMLVMFCTIATDERVAEGAVGFYARVVGVWFGPQLSLLLQC